MSDVAVGAEHACARFADGSVRCWGSDGAGELGTRGPAVDLAQQLGRSLRSVALGPRHGCGLDDAGAVWCWGANDYGQLGNDGYESAPSPVAAPITDATQVVVGVDFSCALTSASAVQCWGRNDRGQLGRGKPASKPLPPIDERAGSPPGRTAPAPVPGAAAALLLGEHTSCVRLGSGPHWRCWGLPSYELPEPTKDRKQRKVIEAASIPKPGPVGGLGPAAALGAGRSFACALQQDGSVACWGAADRGQLGASEPKDRFAAAPVPGLDAVTAFGLGDDHGCALRADGSVWCWGANGASQLGRSPTATPGPQAGAVPGLAGVRALRVGAHFACALGQGGLQCWGAGGAGQLGRAASSESPELVPF